MVFVINLISWVYLAMLIFLLEYSKELQEFPRALAVRTLSSNVEGMGSIPGLGTKILHTVGCYQKPKKKKIMHTHSFPHEHSFWRMCGSIFVFGKTELKW